MCHLLRSHLICVLHLFCSMLFGKYFLAIWLLIAVIWLVKTSHFSYFYICIVLLVIFCHEWNICFLYRLSRFKWIWFFVGQIHYEAIMTNGTARLFVTPVNFVPKDEWFQLILSCETFQVFIILLNITLLETDFDVSDLFLCAIRKIRKLSCYKCIVEILYWMAYVQRAKAWKIESSIIKI